MIFENLAHDFPNRVEYRRDGTGLRAVIAGPGRNGKKREIPFENHRCEGEQRGATDAQEASASHGMICWYPNLRLWIFAVASRCTVLHPGVVRCRSGSSNLRIRMIFRRQANQRPWPIARMPSPR